MEKRVTGIYFAVVLIGILYAVFAAVSFRSHIMNRIEDKEVVTWDGLMETTQEGNIYYICIFQ